MKNRRKFIYWTLLISWMLFIAIMSHKPANISDSYSMSIISSLDKMGVPIGELFGENTNFFIRKCAHFIEYVILAILADNLLNIYFDKKRSIILTIFLVCLYAFSDEFHQLFIPGREGSFRDVLIDTSGGITALIMKMIYNMFFKKK